MSSALRAAHRVVSAIDRRIDVVAVARTWEELNRARTVLDSWARDPQPSDFDAEVGPEIARIEQAILTGVFRLVLEAYGSLQGGLKRISALKEQARRLAEG